MAKRVIYSPEATADRIQILNYWNKRLGTKEYSIKLDKMFKESIDLLSHFPFLGRRLANKEERVLVKDHYQIYYMDEMEAIEILHIWDSRRNTEELNL